MTLKVTFELSNKDLRHFRAIMREARKAATSSNDTEIISAAEKLLVTVGEVKVPDFVVERLQKLRIMIDMLNDDEWAIPSRERGRVLSALAYFSEPDDLIPDHIPGLGFLDDAIMIELVVRELKHEIEAYEDFCRFRKDLKSKRKAAGSANLSPEEKLAARRKSLHERMRRRGSRNRRSRRSGGGPRVTLF